jgi:hypothetical protein
MSGFELAFGNLLKADQMGMNAKGRKQILILE